MSPHGSKLKELIRYLANLLLTDSQRKKIKTVLAQLQQIPFKLLGIEALIDAQKEEIERLKSRLTILDGKFNVALYGMPSIDEKYRAYSVSNSFLNRYEPPSHLRDWVATHVRSKISEEGQRWLDDFQSISLFKDFEPKKCLVMGAENIFGAENDFNPSRVQQEQGIRRVFRSSERIFISETDAGILTSLQKNNLGQVEWMGTDPLTTLLALAGMHLDLILCLHRYQRLAPSEQLHFLNLAQERLSPGGILVISAPNLSHPEIAKDYYWSDVRNLRPYSATLIQNIMSTFPGELVSHLDRQEEKEQAQALKQELFWVFKKSQKGLGQHS